MPEISEGEGSLISEWSLALRFRRRIPLALLLRASEQQPASEPVKRKTTPNGKTSGKAAKQSEDTSRR